MRGILLRSIGAIAALLMAPGALGATIFSQTPSATDEWCADFSTCSHPNLANEFTAVVSDTVDLVTWRGTQDADVIGDDFTLYFFADNGGNPGTLLQSFAIGASDTKTSVGGAGSGTGNSPIYEYTADLGSGIALTGGTQYWLGMDNSTAGSGDLNWYWIMDYSGLSNSRRAVGLSFWVNAAGDGSADHYFILNGSAVPVPAAVWLFGSALGLLGWMRHKAT